MNNTCPTCRHNLLSGATNATNATNAVQEPRAPNSFRGIEIPIETEININTFYNELLRNSANIPGFELNSVNDDSVVFSFDLMNGTAPPANHEHMDEVDGVDDDGVDDDGVDDDGVDDVDDVDDDGVDDVDDVD